MSSPEEPFTGSHFVSLLELAKERFTFAPFTDIPWDSSFVLWRHDVDCSLNRAFRCGEEEQRLGVLATYFINPTSSFYNPFEASQAQLVRDIAAMGHRIGLHFDANGVSPPELDAAIKSQRLALEEIVGVSVEAVSFHNPRAEHLGNDADTYGGLINAYSRTLMQDVTYSSDSNGYWRHRPLLDVLKDVSVSRLQVLTHPGWWQDTVMPPRSRILRSVYGRASHVMSEYDGLLLRDGRENRSGDLPLIAGRDVSEHGRAGSAQQTVVDFLWHAEAFVALYAYLSEILTGLEGQRQDLDWREAGPTPVARAGPSSGANTSGDFGAASLHGTASADLGAIPPSQMREACIEMMSYIASTREGSSYGDSETARTSRSTR